MDANGIIIVISSVTGAAVIKLLDGVVQWCLQRKARREDNEVADVNELKQTVDSLRNGMMAMMLDRIQYLCKGYINDREVDFDDRRRLRIMHRIYHDDLKGNGDLDILMHQVDELPLKEDK